MRSRQAMALRGNTAYPGREDGANPYPAHQFGCVKAPPGPVGAELDSRVHVLGAVIEARGNSFGESWGETAGIGRVAGAEGGAGSGQLTSF